MNDVLGWLPFIDLALALASFAIGFGYTQYEIWSRRTKGETFNVGSKGFDTRYQQVRADVFDGLRISIPLVYSSIVLNIAASAIAFYQSYDLAIVYEPLKLVGFIFLIRPMFWLGKLIADTICWLRLEHYGPSLYPGSNQGIRIAYINLKDGAVEPDTLTREARLKQHTLWKETRHDTIAEYRPELYFWSGLAIAGAVAVYVLTSILPSDRSTRELAANVLLLHPYLLVTGLFITAGKDTFAARITLFLDLFAYWLGAQFIGHAQVKDPPTTRTPGGNVSDDDDLGGGGINDPTA
jgi:hypothetical protein